MTFWNGCRIGLKILLHLTRVEEDTVKIYLWNLIEDFKKSQCCLKQCGFSGVFNTLWLALIYC